jgi:secretion/DNA translocation related TadE-like protein
MRTRGPGAGRPGREAGSATMLAITLTVLLTVVAVGVSVLGGLLVDQRRAAAAADLAALAGAGAAQQGRPGCAAAGAVAVRNDARLGVCQEHAGVLTLTVTRQVQVGFGAVVTVRARARAGP